MRTISLLLLCMYASEALCQQMNKCVDSSTVIFSSPQNVAAKKNVQVIPLNFYTTNLGFFCRQELKMQKAHVPVTFRFGSMDDCNRLEQKPGYR